MGFRNRSVVLVAVCATVAGALAGTAPAIAESGEWRVAAPVSAQSVAPEALVRLDKGKLSLEVRHGGTTVLEPSALGIRTADADLTSGLKFVGSSSRLVQDSYTTVSGKKRQHTYVGTETTFHLQ